MKKLENYKSAFEATLREHLLVKEPSNLYQPIKYILDLGGKRLRPLLTLMTCDFFGESINKAMDAALAVELFHNFSLIHDDIMDEAPLRRGEATVHQKWDINTAILSGDAMLILAYQYFENYEPSTFRNLAKLFSKTAIQVCEGQQYDVDFETRSNVTINEYLKMIEYKTAVLVGAAMKMGATVAGATPKCQDAIYEYGKNLGIAFQLQDDHLDAFGNPENFGKQVGGDILTNKKTYLYLKAEQLANPEEKEILQKLFLEKNNTPEEKVTQVKQIFESSGSKDMSLHLIREYTQKAFSNLDEIELTNDKKQQLVEFGNWLMHRTS